MRGDLDLMIGKPSTNPQTEPGPNQDEPNQLRNGFGYLEFRDVKNNVESLLQRLSRIESLQVGYTDADLRGGGLRGELDKALQRLTCLESDPSAASKQTEDKLKQLESYVKLDLQQDVSAQLERLTRLESSHKTSTSFLSLGLSRLESSFTPAFKADVVKALGLTPTENEEKKKVQFAVTLAEADTDRVQEEMDAFLLRSLGLLKSVEQDSLVGETRTALKPKRKDNAQLVQSIIRTALQGAERRLPELGEDVVLR